MPHGKHRRKHSNQFNQNYHKGNKHDHKYKRINKINGKVMLVCSFPKCKEKHYES